MNPTPDPRADALDDALLERYEAWCNGSSAGDPVPEEFAELAAGSALLRETLAHEVDAVPDVAFAAMWSRVQSELEHPPRSFWSRTWERWTQSWRLPVTAMAGVAAAGLVWVVAQQPEPSSEPQQMRTAMLPEGAPVAARARSVVVDKVDAPQAAAAPLAAPRIENIDFAQGGGRIDKIEHARGTTTVVWIEAPLAARAKKTMDL